MFEAWFASSAAYDEQRARRLVACPVCGDTGVDKAVMAPNVGVKGNRAVSPPAAKALLSRLAEAQAKLLDGSRWVGRDFAAEARAMHAGDKPDAPIHGQASVADIGRLVEEGVPVAPLPLPVTPPKTLN